MSLTPCSKVTRSLAFVGKQVEFTVPDYDEQDCPHGDFMLMGMTAVMATGRSAQRASPIA